VAAATLRVGAQNPQSTVRALKIRAQPFGEKENPQTTPS